MNSPLELDPASETFRDNAREIFHRLLRERPVAPLADGRVLLCRHADVERALTDHTAFRRPTQWSNERKPEGPFRDFGRSNMIGMNPPDHTRFRRAIMRAFAPRRVEQLCGLIERTCDQLLDAMSARDEGDFIQDFALPLPITVICALLDIPTVDRGLFSAGTAAMLAGLEISATPAELERAGESASALFDYLDSVARERERNLGDDLISLLIRHEHEDQLTREEVVWAAITLLIAGHETTTHLIGNGLLALVQEPDQQRRLAREPALTEGAVEEFLRYDPTLYVLFRETMVPLRLGGVDIPERTLLILSIAAANRDPEVFDAPDTLDITRSNARAHLTFAAGRHLCAGHAVARLEGRIAFTKLLDRFAEFQLAGTPIPRNGLMFKGYHSLPVSYRQRV
ncbi:MAG: cytochrome P450 [Pseudomonadales bacterium]